MIMITMAMVVNLTIMKPWDCNVSDHEDGGDGDDEGSIMITVVVMRRRDGGKDDC